MILLKAKHVCDNNCNHNRKFEDPVLEGLQQTLDDSFNVMLHTLGQDIAEVLGIKDPLVKSGRAGKRADHDFVRTETKNGKDVQIYKDENGKEYERGQHPDDKGHQNTPPGRKLIVRPKAPKFVTAKQKMQDDTDKKIEKSLSGGIALWLSKK